MGGGQVKRVEVDPNWEASKRCHFRIVNRLKEGIEDDVVQAIADRLKGGKDTKDGGGQACAESLIKEGAPQSGSRDAQ